MDILQSSAAPARLTRLRVHRGGKACGDALLSRSARYGASLMLERSLTHSLNRALLTFSPQGRHARRAPCCPAE